MFSLFIIDVYAVVAAVTVAAFVTLSDNEVYKMLVDVVETATTRRAAL